MTTDTTALQERIARALYENAEYYGPEDVQPAREHRDDEEREEWIEIAAAVLPIVAEEVRKAKAEAWDEGQEAGYRNAEAKRPYDEMWTGEEPILIDNPHRRQKAVMSDDEYEAISEAEWKALATTEITHLTDEEEDYLPRAWDEWIARVRRDAAREAMEGLASDFDLMGSQEDGPEVARWIRAVIDTEYPEETP